jgi:hypothetical protein
VQRSATSDPYAELVVIEQMVPSERDVHGFWKAEVRA